MKRTTKTIAILLAFIIGLGLLAACGSTESSNTPAATSESPAASTPAPAASPSPGTHAVIEATAPEEGANIADHIDIIGDSQITVVNLWMPAATGATNSWASLLIYDCLVEQLSPTEFGPRLATSWHTDDYQTFSFTLRDDVYYHNGDHFTAEDIAWTAEVGKQQTASPAFNTWRWVDYINVIDPYNIEIVLTEVYVDYMFLLGNSQGGIQNRRSHDENPDDPTWAWVGTGPYKVVGFETNDYLTLERNEDYWGEKPPTRSLTFWTIPEMATRTLMLQNGEAQIAFGTTPEDLDMLNADPDFQVFTVNLNPPVIFGFNNQGDDIVMDVNFRLAVAHALNIDDIATVAMGMWAEPAWDGSFWGPVTQFRRNDFPRREQDLDLAKQYLAQSIYDGRTLEIMTTAAHNIRASELIQLQLAAVGIDVNIETMDQSSFIDAHNYNPESTRQLHVFSVPMFPAAVHALNSGFYPGSFANRLNLNFDYVTERIERMGVTADEADRAALAHEIQEYYYENVVGIPLFWRVTGNPAVNGIGGIRLSPDSFAHCLRGIFWDLNETAEHLRP